LAAPFIIRPADFGRAAELADKRVRRLEAVAPDDLPRVEPFDGSTLSIEAAFAEAK
jgi:hypothetical protein